MCKTITWLRSLFSELQHNTPNPKCNLAATERKTDSTSAISLVRKQQVTERKKHIDLKVHHIKELHNNGIIKLVHEKTTNMPEDILTKPVQGFVLDRLLHHFNVF